jgi:hypothetical protein
MPRAHFGSVRHASEPQPFTCGRRYEEDRKGQLPGALQLHEKCQPMEEQRK